MSAKQLTVGELIEVLADMNGEDKLYTGGPVSLGITRIESYRGYYEQCSVVPTQDYSDMTASKLRSALVTAVEHRTVFEGYKGGNYVFNNATRVWIAGHGKEGVPLHRVTETGYGVLLLSNDEWWLR